MQKNWRIKIRRTLDICMTGIMLLLTAALTIGEAPHEWLGIAETVLVILHQVLNRKWYAALFRGTYSVYRVVAAAGSMMLLAAFFLTAVSGMAMSIHATPFLYGIIPAVAARRMHLSMSGWCFIFMGVHLGFHIACKKTEGGRFSRKWVSGIVLVAAAAGLYLFFRNRVPDYLLFRTPFAYSSYGGSVILTLAGNMAMLVLWVLAGAKIADLCRRRQKNF